jgi:PAS domain S-box-containing protein
MKNHDKTKNQLVTELVKLRQRIAEFEISEAQRKKAEDLLKGIETESKQAHEAIKASETRYRRLFETAQDGILILEAETGRINDVNPFFIQMLGYSHEEFLGKKLWEIGLFKDIVSSQNAFSELQEKGYIRYEDLPLETKDGRNIDVEFVSNVYLVNGNKVIQCNIRDITRRKNTEKELRHLTDELKRSNEDLQQFAYAASHDLQEPLRGIEGFTKLLEKHYKGKLDGKADEFIDHIIDDTKRMQMLIKDLLEYSRVSTQGIVFRPTNCSVALEEAIYNLRTAVKESNVELTYDLLPTVTADASQLSRLFQNLIGNAIKFRGNKPLKIHISAEQKGDEWVFPIKDNSIGIEPKFFERIFSVFQRLHTRNEYKGTGIGLAVCKKIVERHGGRIWVESEPGKGSTFYFTIPDRDGSS